jgi:hypothetical protein
VAAAVAAAEGSVVSAAAALAAAEQEEAGNGSGLEMARICNPCQNKIKEISTDYKSALSSIY